MNGFAIHYLINHALIVFLKHSCICTFIIPIIYSLVDVHMQLVVNYLYIHTYIIYSHQAWGLLEEDLLSHDQLSLILLLGPLMVAFVRHLQNQLHCITATGCMLFLHCLCTCNSRSMWENFGGVKGW